MDGVSQSAYWHQDTDDPVLGPPPSTDRLSKILDSLSHTPSQTARAFLHAVLTSSENVVGQSASFTDGLSDNLSTVVTPKVAAVLVLVTIDEITGEPMVTLTTRSKLLRTHPGDTALPGGKQETGDVCLEATALREAYEEIGLPISAETLIPIARIAPYPSATFIEVHPCIYLWTGPSHPQLRPDPAEVDTIFDASLRAFLCLDGEGQYAHSYKDLVWISGTTYRLHIFQDAQLASDVTGLTAEMLCDIATMGYRLSPTFARHAEDQLSPAECFKRIRAGTAKLDPNRNRR